MSGTGIEIVPNLPKCRVPVLKSYRSFRSVGYGYWGRTEVTKVSATGIEFVPNLTGVFGRVLRPYPTLPRTSVGYSPSKYLPYTFGKVSFPYRTRTRKYVLFCMWCRRSMTRERGVRKAAMNSTDDSSLTSTVKLGVYVGCSDSTSNTLFKSRTGNVPTWNKWRRDKSVIGNRKDGACQNEVVSHSNYPCTK